MFFSVYVPLFIWTIRLHLHDNDVVKNRKAFRLFKKMSRKNYNVLKMTGIYTSAKKAKNAALHTPGQ